MSRPHLVPARALVAPLILLLAGGCTDPGDSSAGVFVTVVSAADSTVGSAVLLRGTRARLEARVWERRGADSLELPNASVSWASAAPAKASVTATGYRTAEVTGILSGDLPVAIEARADAFEAAASGTLSLRVADLLEVDSVRPREVRFGEQVTVYGVGIGGLIVAQLEGTPLLADTASFQGERFGLGSMRFWVPPPARSGRLFAVGPGVFLTADDSTIVEPLDKYEPNDSTPWTFRLDQLHPIPPEPILKVVNPALAFEDLRADSVGYDWYRFTTPTPDRPLTVVIDPPGQGGGNRTFLASANNPSGPPRLFDWAIGPGVLACRGLALSPRATPADQLVFALGRLPASSVDLVSEFTIEGAYSMLVVEGYFTVNAAIGPDRFEEDDLCDLADQNFLTPGLGITLATPFVDSLSIDNPYDIDWLKIRVPGATARQLSARVAMAPSSVPAVIGGDRTDLGLFLLTAGPTPSLVDGTQKRDDSDESITVTVPPGDYYLVVVDQGGAPARYGICAAIGASCTAPTPAPAVGGPVRSLSAWLAGQGPRP
ncbi:MAG: PPC domain-containing protein [Gemmatimonadales bacterium]